MSKKLSLCLAAVLLAGSLLTPTARAQVVDQDKGSDPKVDYEALKRIGPWDDRNYSLDAEDLEVLAANEADQRPLVPAFYRVELRKRYPDMPKTGEHQYPRSTLPRFLVEYGGLLIDGQLYRSAHRTDDGYVVDTETPWMSRQEWQEKQLSGEVRLGPGAETAVAINPVDPDKVIAGSNGPGGQVMYYSDDGGETWSSTGALPNSCCDPTVAWSTDGTRAYAVTLGANNDVYLSTNNGQTWTLLDVVGTGFVDKEYLHVDGHATSPYKDNLYLTWHLSGNMRFSRSTNLGVSWSPEVSLSSGGAEEGIGSDITSDRSGNVYYIWPTFSGGNTWMRKSTDGGATFEPTRLVLDTVGSYDFPIPAMDNRLAFMYVSADTDLTNGPYADTIYVAQTDNTGPDSGNPNSNHARIRVAYSRNGGDTWSVSTPHETADSDTVDRFHPWLKVGPDGKVWVVFYDTRNSPDRQDVDFYYSVSDDGAQTWSAPERLTTVSSPEPNDSFEWGDYNGMDLVMDQLIGIYTDNRNEGGGSGDSIDVYVVGTLTSTSEIFRDGFEAGSTSAWDGSSP
ncbi:MAG: sialidase family protein [Acidobacteriota bacterium]